MLSFSYTRRKKVGERQTTFIQPQHFKNLHMRISLVLWCASTAAGIGSSLVGNPRPQHSVQRGWKTKQTKLSKINFGRFTVLRHLTHIQIPVATNTIGIQNSTITLLFFKSQIFSQLLIPNPHQALDLLYITFFLSSGNVYINGMIECSTFGDWLLSPCIMSLSSIQVAACIILSLLSLFFFWVTFNRALGADTELGYTRHFLMIARAVAAMKSSMVYLSIFYSDAFNLLSKPVGQLPAHFVHFADKTIKQWERGT